MSTCKIILFVIIMYLLMYIFSQCRKEYYRASWCPDSQYDSTSTSTLDYPAFQLACGKGRKNTKENYIAFEPTTFSPLKTPLMLRKNNKSISEKFTWNSPQFQNKYQYLVGSNQARNYQKRVNEQFCGGCVG